VNGTKVGPSGIEGFRNWINHLWSPNAERQAQVREPILLFGFEKCLVAVRIMSSGLLIYEDFLEVLPAPRGMRIGMTDHPGYGSVIELLRKAPQFSAGFKGC